MTPDLKSFTVLDNNNKKRPPYFLIRRHEQIFYKILSTALKNPKSNYQERKNFQSVLKSDSLKRDLSNTKNYYKQ
jgi:hypothetical protein